MDLDECSTHSPFPFRILRLISLCLPWPSRRLKLFRNPHRGTCSIGAAAPTRLPAALEADPEAYPRPCNPIRYTILGKTGQSERSHPHYHNPHLRSKREAVVVLVVLMEVHGPPNYIEEKRALSSGKQWLHQPPSCRPPQA